MKTIVNVVENLLKPYVDNKDTAAKQAVESNIAPVEADATSASGSYSEGEQLVLNDILYDVTASITAGDPLTVGVNISAAPKLSTAVRGKQEQIDELNDGLANEAATRSALGAKNRMPLTLDSLKQIATSGTWNNNVYSENGIDYTVNTNSSGYVISIVVSGTASSLSSMNLLGDNSTYVSNDYAGMILTGCPSGGGNDNYRTVVFIGDSQDGTGHTSQYEDGNGVTIGSNSYVRIYIRIASGTDLTTPITFYPMIRVATDSNSDFEPYADDNQTLTAKVAQNATEISSVKQALTKQSTVNGAVNELDHTEVTDTSGTVKFTVNDDKTITVSASSYPVTLSRTTTFFFYGSSSAAVPNIFKGRKLTGCPSGGATEKYKIVAQEFSSATPSEATAEHSDVGEGASISNGDYIRIYIRLASGYQLTSALTFKPMISLPELGLSYSDYVPYSMPNRQLTTDKVDWDDYSELGAVNYCPNDAKTQTVTTDGANVTFTVNDDGSVTVNGTAGTSNVTLVLKANDTFWENALKIGQTYRLSGCPSGGSDSTYCLQSFRMPTVFDYGDGAVFTFDNMGTNKLVQIVIFAGATVSNLTFKPMITPVSYNGPYVPYAKTNKELTDELSVDSTSVTNNGVTAEFSKWGKVATINWTGAFTEGVATDGLVLTIPSGFRPKSVVGMKTTNELASSSKEALLYLANGGNLTIAYPGSAAGDALRGAFTYITD